MAQDISNSMVDQQWKFWIIRWKVNCPDKVKLWLFLVNFGNQNFSSSRHFKLFKVIIKNQEYQKKSTKVKIWNFSKHLEKFLSVFNTFFANFMAIYHQDPFWFKKSGQHESWRGCFKLSKMSKSMKKILSGARVLKLDIIGP